MTDSDLDTQTLAEYRRVIEQAAATSPDARAAVGHIFAALDRRDKVWHHMREENALLHKLVETLLQAASLSRDPTLRKMADDMRAVK